MLRIGVRYPKRLDDHHIDYSRREIRWLVLCVSLRLCVSDKQMAVAYLYDRPIVSTEVIVKRRRPRPRRSVDVCV